MIWYFIIDISMNISRYHLHCINHQQKSVAVKYAIMPGCSPWLYEKHLLNAQ